MANGVAQYVTPCLVCQKDKSDNLTQAGLLEPLHVPKRPWENVSLDFLTGLPKVGDLTTILVVVDQFSNNFWTQLFKCLESKLSHSSSFHPQSDGQTERFNGMLEVYLRHFIIGSQKNWMKLVDAAQLSQKRMKKHTDQNRRFVEYQVGDKVMVTKRYLFAEVHDPRLLQKYIGPLSIEKRIEKVAYRVDTPAWWKIHLVFYVSLLKLFWEDMEDPSRSQLTIPNIRGPNSTEKMRVEAILDDRVAHASRKITKSSW
nr:uncharacterized protein LOC117278077 [Nicotiana tomentosiformis]